MELKDALTYLGLNPETVTDLDQFKAEFKKTFVHTNEIESRDDIVNPIIGKKIGALEVAYIREMKEAGIEFTPEEKQGKRLSDLMTIGKDKLMTRAAELEKAAKGAGNGSEEAERLKAEIKEIKTRLKEEEDARKAALVEVDRVKETYANEAKQAQLQASVAAMYQQVPFKAQMTEAERLGLQALVNSKYRFTFAEDSSLQITDANGKRIENPAKAGDFLQPVDVLKAEAEKQMLLQKTDPTKFKAGDPYKAAQQQQQTPLRTVKAPLR